jgi:hypothetical protein
VHVVLSALHWHSTVWWCAGQWWPYGLRFAWPLIFPIRPRPVPHEAAGAYIRDRAHARYVREGSLKGGAPLKTWQRNMVVQDVRPRTSYFFLVFLVFFVFLVFLMFLVFLVLALMYLWYLVMVSWNARRAAAGTIFFSSACLMVT